MCLRHPVSSATHCRCRLTPTVTHPVTYCKTLQRTATRTIHSTLQNTATCTISEMTTGITCPPLQHILQHTAIHCNSRDLDDYDSHRLPPTATHTTHTAIHCYSRDLDDYDRYQSLLSATHTATHCSPLQYAATCAISMITTGTTCPSLQHI